MISQSKRPYRKNLALPGLIYMEENEQAVIVQNLSITGALVKLCNDVYGDDIKHIFNVISVSSIVDLYIPELRLAGEAEIVRADTTDNHHTVLALEFKSVSHCVDKWQYKRKAYRKILADTGRILLNGKCYDFTSVNASVDGLMIRLADPIAVEEGTITRFEFKRLGLNGKSKIIWVDALSDEGTFIGLQYLNIQKDDIKGLPGFHE